jgi:hypothetical protein
LQTNGHNTLRQMNYPEDGPHSGLYLLQAIYEVQLNAPLASVNVSTERYFTFLDSNFNTRLSSTYERLIRLNGLIEQLHQKCTRFLVLVSTNC